ncbi:phosphoglycerate kinase [Mycobacterium ulcerans str. Harvey]|uniref:Phosphoglycerate kinase n=1 Tax=Mycobacterium ulcerans str. Harvey TaxID=1299332 RepID=A0ABN0R0I4_MYCUL|nr:phosphoglycerate kinase [Mycobacterium ulcerans str. Harvey]
MLVRSDLNVPLDENGVITDAGRITASVPTLKALLDGGAKVVVAAHFGRPKDGPDPKLSLEPVAAALGEQLGRHVQLAGDIVGTDALARAEGLTDGDVLLLENIRFDKRETSKDDGERLAFAKQLAELVSPEGAFVSDGFGVVHRKQASVYDVATLLPHYAGRLVADEIRVLEQLTSSTERPYAVVLGGSKVSDKLGVIESLATKADSIVIGGGMCFTFLAAQGYSVGTSLLEKEMIDTCRRLLDTYHDVLRLPVDVVVTEKFAADPPPQTVAADAIPADTMGLDIGPGSVKRFAALLSNAKTIFWNGPMGVFEFPAYATGTRASPRRLSRRPARVRSAWSAAVTPPPRFARLAFRRDRSRTFPPAAARRWNTWRARRCPASRCSVDPSPAKPRAEDPREPQAVDRRQLEDEPQSLRGDRSGAEDRILVAGQVLRQSRCDGHSAVHRLA